MSLHPQYLLDPLIDEQFLIRSRGTLASGSHCFQLLLALLRNFHWIRISSWTPRTTHWAFYRRPLLQVQVSSSTNTTFALHGAGVMVILFLDLCFPVGYGGRCSRHCTIVAALKERTNRPTALVNILISGLGALLDPASHHDKSQQNVAFCVQNRCPTMHHSSNYGLVPKGTLRREFTSARSNHCFPNKGMKSEFEDHDEKGTDGKKSESTIQRTDG